MGEGENRGNGDAVNGRAGEGENRGTGETGKLRSGGAVNGR